MNISPRSLNLIVIKYKSPLQIRKPSVICETWVQGSKRTQNKRKDTFALVSGNETGSTRIVQREVPNFLAVMPAIYQIYA